MQALEADRIDTVNNTASTAYTNGVSPRLGWARIGPLQSTDARVPGLGRPRGDANGDGRMDFADLLILASKDGSSSPARATPATDVAALDLAAGNGVRAERAAADHEPVAPRARVDQEVLDRRRRREAQELPRRRDRRGTIPGWDDVRPRPDLGPRA